MAIIDFVTAYVLVNDVPAREFDEFDEEMEDDLQDVESAVDGGDEGVDNNPATLETTRYVEAVPQQKFAIKISISRHYEWTAEDCVVVNVHMDGKWASGCVIKRPRLYNKNTDHEGTIDGIYGQDNMGTFKLPFEFAKLTTRDMSSKDDPKKLVDKYGQLGLITVKFRRACHLGYAGLNDHNSHRLKSVPEKALKGRAWASRHSHFGTKQRAPASRSAKTEPLESGPFATFNFRYCTRKDLQTMMIVPRSPTPVPVGERPVEQLSREEMAELLQQRTAQLQEAQTRIKHERGVKRERSQSTARGPMRPLKQSRTAEGKTVFHLDSDDEDEVTPAKAAQAEKLKKEKVVLTID